MNGRTPEPRIRLPRVIWVVLLVCSLIEGALWAGDLGHAGSGSLRFRVFELASFRPDLLNGGDPVFAGQAATMFLTYSVLHAGLAHLGVNMLTLVALGTSVVRRTGQGGFLEIYLAAALGGAVGYALIGPDQVPMVGASGALFGLAGALIGWEIAEARSSRQSLWPAARLILLLVVLNAVLWFAAGGRLAWQAHLGGAVAGLIVALLRPVAPERFT